MIISRENNSLLTAHDPRGTHASWVWNKSILSIVSSTVTSWWMGLTTQGCLYTLGSGGCFCLFLVIIFLITLSFPLVAMMRWLGLTFLQSYTLFCRKRAKKRFIMLAIHRAPPWVSSKKVRFVYSGEMWLYMSTAKPGITDFSQIWLLQGHEILISPCPPSCPTTCKYQLREYAGPFEIDT